MQGQCHSEWRVFDYTSTTSSILPSLGNKEWKNMIYFSLSWLVNKSKLDFLRFTVFVKAKKSFCYIIDHFNIFIEIIDAVYWMMFLANITYILNVYWILSALLNVNSLVNIKSDGNIKYQCKLFMVKSIDCNNEASTNCMRYFAEIQQFAVVWLFSNPTQKNVCRIF